MIEENAPIPLQEQLMKLYQNQGNLPLVKGIHLQTEDYGREIKDTPTTSETATKKEFGPIICMPKKPQYKERECLKDLFFKLGLDFEVDVPDNMKDRLQTDGSKAVLQSMTDVTEYKDN